MTQLPPPLRIAAEEAAEKFYKDHLPYVVSIDQAWVGAVQWHHDYLLKSAPEFDAKAAKRAWTHQGENADIGYQMTESEICVFGARWQHQQSAAQIAVLQSEVQRLREQLEKAESLMCFLKSASSDDIAREHLTNYFTDKKGGT